MGAACGILVYVLSWFRYADRLVDPTPEGAPGPPIPAYVNLKNSVSAAGTQLGCRCRTSRINASRTGNAYVLSGGRTSYARPYGCRV
jgi:hypothetical protein